MGILGRGYNFSELGSLGGGGYSPSWGGGIVELCTISIHIQCLSALIQQSSTISIMATDKPAPRPVVICGPSGVG